MRYTLLFGILIYLLSACSSSQRPPIPLTAPFPEEVNIQSTPVGKELIMNLPMWIEWRDSNLFLIQPGGCAAKVVRASDASEVAIFGPIGKGPDEFLTPCFIRDDEESYIYLILPVNFNAVS